MLETCTVRFRIVKNNQETRGEEVDSILKLSYFLFSVKLYADLMVGDGSERGVVVVSRVAEKVFRGEVYATCTKPAARVGLSLFFLFCVCFAFLFCWGFLCFHMYFREILKFSIPMAIWPHISKMF